MELPIVLSAISAFVSVASVIVAVSYVKFQTQQNTKDINELKHKVEIAEAKQNAMPTELMVLLSQRDDKFHGELSDIVSTLTSKLDSITEKFVSVNTCEQIRKASVKGG